MARVTVEDCLEFVENRFDLVLKATKIARKLQFGTEEPKVPIENDKPTVIALREIAEGLHVSDNTVVIEELIETAEESDVTPVDLEGQPIVEEVSTEETTDALIEELLEDVAVVDVESSEEASSSNDSEDQYSDESKKTAKEDSLTELVSKESEEDSE